MIKALEKQTERDRERGKTPKTAQEALPIYAAHEDGVFLLSPQSQRTLRGPRTMHKYAQTWRFTDINYAVANREDKESLFLRCGQYEKTDEKTRNSYKFCSLHGLLCLLYGLQGRALRLGQLSNRTPAGAWTVLDEHRRMGARR